VAVLTQIIVFPLFGLQVSLVDNLAIGVAFTAISLARSFVLRRVFEAIRVRGTRTITAGHGARRHRPC
jgi:NhaP-type Na+/H+ or K+/H+ antiporter